MKSILLLCLHSFLFFTLLWLIISLFVFRLRHPWATETETILNVHRAFFLDKVEYHELRPRS